MCGICSFITDPTDCDRVTECGQHEVCYVEKYASSGGHLLYDVGCKSSHECKSIVEKRREEIDDSPMSGDFQMCSSCCNDTKLCNVIGGHCGSQALDMSDRVLCYHCNHLRSPDQCETVRACPIYEQCYIEQSEGGVSGSLLWTSRCGHESANCRSPGIPIDSVVGKKRSSEFCAACCSEDLCNNNCTLATGNGLTTPTIATGPLSIPVITFVTRLYDVQIGSYIHLTCRAHGNPTPKVSWSFSAPVKPENIRTENNGADIYIDGVTEENYGHYACNAMNSQGQDNRFVDILEHGPSG